MKIDFLNLIELPKDIQMQCRNWRNCPNVTKHFVIKYIDQQVHVDWLNSMKENAPKNIAFTIKADEDFIGMIYLKNIDYDLKTAEIGIYIRKIDMINKGIGSKALNFIINFSKNKFNYLTIQCFDENIKAVHLYQKIGFQFIEKLNLAISVMI
jgi:RimJ/RimL family protein N-acetyltransferase